MITKQSFYIKGINPDNEEEFAGNAAGATVLFIVTFVSSITMIKYDSWNREQWDQVALEDDVSLLPRGMSEYNVRTDSELEMSDFNSSHSTHSASGQINLPEIS
jgi:hypothetical protein